MAMLLKRLGAEFRANAAIPGNQLYQTVAPLTSGGFAMAWIAESGDGNGYGIAAQRFNADGAKVGGEIQVNNVVLRNQLEPSISGLPSGGFVVTWTDESNATSSDIRGRIFDSAGTALAADFVVNTTTAHHQTASNVFALAGGGFVVSWNDIGDTSNLDTAYNIRAQIFDAAGARVGQEFPVNLSLPGVQARPHGIALGSGGFVIVWNHVNNGEIDVRGQLFDSAGNRIGSEFNVPTNAVGGNADIAALPNGGFVVSWEGGEPGSTTYVARAQMFDANGAKVGPEVTASNVENRVSTVNVTSLASGGFLVSWEDYQNATPTTQAQMFDAEGNRLGSQLQLNLAAKTGGYSDLATLSSGRVVATWNYGTYDVNGQVFRAPLIGTPLADTLDGGVEDDAIAGLASDDILSGGGGNDTIDGGAGADRMTGGAGNDLYVVDNAGDEAVEQANEGTDEIETVLADYALPDHVENLTGTSVAGGGQTLRGNAASNVLTGGAGSDIFHLGAAGNDTARGGAGDDLLVIDWSDATTAFSMGGGPSQDFAGQQLLGYRGNYQDGGGRSVAFFGIDRFDIAAGSADDQLRGGGGDDSLYGGDGNDQIAGEAGNDFLRGEAGADTLTGGSGADDIDGGVGADTLYGDQALPFSMAGDGDDLLSGGAGNDLIRGGGGADTIDGGGDFDQLYGGAGEDLVDGGDGDDFISGFGEESYGVDLHSDTLRGGTGNDRITAGYGDSVDGGAGTDTLFLNLFSGTAGVTADLRQLANGGSTTVAGATLSGIEYIGLISLTPFDDVVIAGPATIPPDPAGRQFSGWGGNDDLTGSSDVEMISGGDGDDVLRGGGGHNPAVAPSGDRLYGEGGNDILHIGNDSAIASGGWGDDIIYGGDGGDSLNGDDGQDKLYGGGGVDGLSGGWGNDLIEGGAGDDIIYGGSGDDSMSGGSGDDVYYDVDSVGDVVIENEGEGTDQVRTSLATYSLLGTGIENLVAATNLAHDFRGNGGDNLIEGGHGNDLLRLNDGGDDVVHGLGGNDVLYFGTALSAGDVANGGSGRDAIVLQGNYTTTLSGANISGIESISLQSGANTNFGDTANEFYDFDITTTDSLVAAGQQMIVNAQSLRAGEDFTFDGSAEQDGKFLVYGGHGVDNLTGGAGVDVFFFEGQRWGPDDKVDGGAGRDAVVISGGNGLTHIEFAADALTNIESISVNNHFATDPSQKPSYELVLHNGNVAPGGTLIVNGSSVAAGQVVNIDGSGVHDGNLILFGGGGHDVVTAGDGADVIVGGGGADSLGGGAGADTFRYDAVSDSAAGLSDLIGDFATGIDKVDLSRIDANTHADGDQAFSWIGSSAFSGNGAASAGELRVFEDNGYQRIEGDTDGDGLADLVIVLQIGTAPLVSGDFLL